MVRYLLFSQQVELLHKKVLAGENMISLKSQTHMWVDFQEQERRLIRNLSKLKQANSNFNL